MHFFLKAGFLWGPFIEKKKEQYEQHHLVMVWNAHHTHTQNNTDLKLVSILKVLIWIKPAYKHRFMHDYTERHI